MKQDTKRIVFRILAAVLLAIVLPAPLFFQAATCRADPYRHLIQNVPYVRQKPYYCGPAAMEMVLKYSGIFDLDQDFLALADPDNPTGTHFRKLVDYFNRHAINNGFHAQAIYGDISLLKRYLAADTPVIVRQWDDIDKTYRHYRVATGYDDRRRRIYYHDPQSGPDRTMSYDLFINLWDIYDRNPVWRSRNLMIVVRKK